MPMPKDDVKIVIFSASSVERDYLRHCVNGIPATVLCFEKETIIFDNYKSILPEIVIVSTDSWTIARRFVFAMHALAFEGTLLIASDVINPKRLGWAGLSVNLDCVSSMPNGAGINEAIRKVKNSPPSKAQMTNQPLLVGDSRQIRHIRSMLPILSNSRDSVLLYGEAGTGKELLARMIVNNQPCAFVKLNCAELIPEMIARLRMPQSSGFANAQVSDDHPLVFLLDKIHLLHPNAQSEVLLLLEGVENSSILGSDAQDLRIRFIATTEEDLEYLVRQGRFRKDLFYRLNVIPIHMPALRERPDDISLLLDYFILEACARSGKSFFVPTEHTRESLCCYEWPGNIDELRNLMYRLAVTGSESFIFSRYSIPRERSVQENPWQLLKGGVLPESMDIQSYLPEADDLSLKSICETFVSRTEKKVMRKALEKTNWNRKKAAALLNISYKSMLNKMKSYDLP